MVSDAQISAISKFQQLLPPICLLHRYVGLYISRDSVPVEDLICGFLSISEEMQVFIADGHDEKKMTF